MSGFYDFSGEWSQTSKDSDALQNATTNLSIEATIGNTRQVNVATLVSSGIICTVGLIGNLLVIFVILVLREYEKSVTHWYVLQLAIADSLFLLTLPFNMAEDIHGNWIYSEWMCKGKETLLFLNYYASILFLVILSIDRYLAVCHTFSKTRKFLHTRGVSAVITTVNWLVALLMCIPVMLYSFKIGQKGSCLCGYQFPPDPANETAKCLEDGYTVEELPKCFQQNMRIGPEPYCIDVQSYSPTGIKMNSLINYTGTEDTLEADFGDSGIFSDIGNSSYMDYPEYYYNDTASEDLNSINLLSTLVNASAFTDPTLGEGIDIACHYWTKPSGWTAMLVYNFVVMFLIPLLVMVACYGLIIHRLSTTRMRTASTHSNPPPGSSCRGRKHSSRSDRDRRRVTIMCASLVACFVFCWLPFHAVHMAKIAGIKSIQSHLCETLPVAASLLVYLNSALNPYLYCFLGTGISRRWNSVATTVRNSVKARTTELSDRGTSLRFTKKLSNGRIVKSVSSATGVTMIHKKDGDSSTTQVKEVNISMAETQELFPVDTGTKENPELIENGESDGLVLVEEK